jgi:hypothetical protein
MASNFRSTCLWWIEKSATGPDNQEQITPLFPAADASIDIAGRETPCLKAQPAAIVAADCRWTAASFSSSSPRANCSAADAIAG